jgi:hypothetical protein
MMEENNEMIESLLERVTGYGKIGLELLKLKTIDKTSDIVSTIIPKTVFLVFMVTFFLFFSVGMAFLLGDILGSNASGFVIVAAFYGTMAVMMHYMMHKWIKKLVRDYINKQLLK